MKSEKSFLDNIQLKAIYVCNKKTENLINIKIILILISQPAGTAGH